MPEAYKFRFGDLVYFGEIGGLSVGPAYCMRADGMCFSAELKVPADDPVRWVYAHEGAD